MLFILNITYAVEFVMSFTLHFLLAAWLIRIRGLQAKLRTLITQYS